MATLGSWRTLTLGAEYEDTWWAPSPDKTLRPGQRAEGEPGPVDETGTCAGDTEESSWRAFNTDTSQKYDAVYRLHGLSRAARRDGVRQMIKKHESLNTAMWPRR